MNIFDFFQKCEDDEKVLMESRGIYVIREREDLSHDQVYSLWGPPQRFAGEFNKIVSPCERYGIYRVRRVTGDVLEEIESLKK